jgi:hypothetical protein
MDDENVVEDLNYSNEGYNEVRLVVWCCEI